MAGAYEGKVAFVTGAGSGIGRATAIAFAAEGAKVALVDLREDGIAETGELIENAGGRSIPVLADVSDYASVEAAVATTVRELGGLDAAFNNAGISVLRAPLAEYPVDVWKQIIDVNLSGVFYCMRAETAYMLQNGGGAIVNTCSSGAVMGMAQAPAYVASKHGVAGLTKTAAIELAGQGVRVNAILPGLVNSPMGLGQPQAMLDFLVSLHPAGRLVEPSELADAVLWLCSDAARYVHGALLPVDGAFTAGVTAHPPLAALGDVA